jgi:uncharacterized protein YutE (UPF0331/DUF86 family)/predicted nucleotidyltransferase
MDVMERAAVFLRRDDAVRAAYAFGNVPEGRSHKDSDLDLAVLLDWTMLPERTARSTKQVELLSDLMQAVGRNRIDLVILNDVPPLFGRRIVREGRLLHVADEGALHDYVRDVQLRAADLEPFIRRARSRLLDAHRRRTFLVEHLSELQRHLDHLESLRNRVPDAAALRADLSLHNDVLFSLLTVSQLVIDIAGELSARGKLGFEDYTSAVRNLERLGFATDMVDSLARLPGFRNVLIHEYVGLDLDRAVRALSELQPVRRFAQEVADRERS